MIRNPQMDRANGVPPNPPPGFEPKKGQGKKVGQGGPPPGQGPKQGQQNVQGGPSVKAVDSGAIFPCLYQFVYIWPTNGSGFWSYITYIGRNSVAGWRFNRGRWQYFGLDLNKIDEFYCY